MTDDAQDAQDAQDGDAVRTAADDRAEVTLSKGEARLLKLVLRTAGRHGTDPAYWEQQVRNQDFPVEMLEAISGVNVAELAEATPDDYPTPAALLRNFRGANDRTWAGTAKEYEAINTALSSWLHHQTADGRDLSPVHDDVVGLMQKIRDGVGRAEGEQTSIVSDEAGRMDP